MNDQRKPAGPRSKKPTDWLSFLEPLVTEIDAALEILRRLRWAVELSSRGRSVAPRPLPGSTQAYEAKNVTGLVADVLMPEEMVARLTLEQLTHLRDEWETEVAEWGRGIWERRGETLRLRARRHDYTEDIEWVRNAPPFAGEEISDAAAARLVNDARAGLLAKLKKPEGALFDAHFVTDPFGNLVPPDEEARLLEKTEEERSEPLEDDSSLRRIVKGTHKKSLGGVRNLDPRLLRPKK